MENLTNNIAETISKELDLDNDRKEVIAYGVFAILQTLLSIGLTVIFSLLFGIFTETMILAFTISILRKYSGGVHSSSPGICAIVSTFVAVGLTSIICFIITPLINLKYVIFLAVLSFFWSYYIINKLAPVDSVAKPIKTRKKKEKMKKTSILILCVCVVIIVINSFLFLLNNDIIFLNFSLCICGGFVWQSFTLTHIGHITIWKIDAFFYRILSFLKGREMV
ncbi:accessory gene regulator ArgB-like protein [Clostridium sp. DL1XJH146]